ncbi:hypothetical protein GQ53DRAFT_662232 [Thozetella sp. PMI_491]|nr:hypothetical protein GQ53DRAFT_662232 [Thozetella sp. PMI_491]
MFSITRSRFVAAHRIFPKGCLPSASGRASFSTTRGLGVKNQVFNPVRSADQFYNYQLLSASNRTPLLSFWTASWCPTCRVVKPLLEDLITSGVGEAEGGVAYCEVVFDAPDVMSANLGLTYMINTLPTLLSFDAQEAQTQTKIVDGKKMSDRAYLEEWIRYEASRHGGRGGGGDGRGPFSGLFSGKH